MGQVAGFVGVAPAWGAWKIPAGDPTCHRRYRQCARARGGSDAHPLRYTTRRTRTACTDRAKPGPSCWHCSPSLTVSVGRKCASEAHSTTAPSTSGSLEGLVGKVLAKAHNPDGSRELQNILQHGSWESQEQILLEMKGHVAEVRALASLLSIGDAPLLESSLRSPNACTATLSCSTRSACSPPAGCASSCTRPFMVLPTLGNWVEATGDRGAAAARP